ncbi:sensor histidine kinase [Glycomyces paridis]|uniref:ATP-binding protein n=1 Tax=Glycomyces paridis TaxID=2126555 RepID=UPI001F02122D|nr:sensor histidine kinase [Glycomyces paridis]
MRNGEAATGTAYDSAEEATMGERSWLNGAMHAGFFLLLAASAARVVARHELTDRHTVAALTVAAILAALYGAGVALWHRLGGARPVWLGLVLGVYVALVLLAPSFAWCAIPLYFLCLRLLPAAATVAAAALLTAAVIAGQLRIAKVVEPSLVLAPIGIAAMITAVFWVLQHEIGQRQRLIDDLVAARDSLADSQQRAGALEERERLAREIHDTLAQGLSSIAMLLQAADRSWGTDRSRALAAQAAAVADENLAEARRFVRDLSPARLDGRTLAEALRLLCADTERRTGLRTAFRSVGEPGPTGDRADAALLRVAQGALANAAEHADATEAVVTLSHLGDAVALDVHDDGRGFDPGTPEAAGPRRGPVPESTAPGPVPDTAGSPADDAVPADRGFDRRTPEPVGPRRGPAPKPAALDSDGPDTAGSPADHGFDPQTPEAARLRRGPASEPAALGPVPDDAPPADRGFGLAGMRARLAAVGGTLTVESHPGEGTTVAAAVPIHAPEED